MRQKLIEPQGETDEFTIIIGDNSLLSEKDRYNRKKINNTINQPSIINIYRLLFQTTAEYISFSSSHGTFTWIDHSLGHKTHLNEY